MNIKKIILTVAIMVVLGCLGMIAKTEPFLAATIATAISAFFIYIIVRDSLVDARLESMEDSLTSQTTLLKRAVTVLPGGAFPMDLIKDPKDPKKWMDFQKEIMAFNAPWTLASGPLFPAFKKFLSQDGAKLRILMFEGKSPDQNTEYETRLANVKKLVADLKEEKVNIMGKLLVNRVVNQDTPSTTFFLSKKGSHPTNHPTALLYIYPFLYEQPMISIEMNDEKAYGAMYQQFTTCWKSKDAEQVEIEDTEPGSP